MAKRKGKIEITGVEMGPSTESELFPHDPAPAPPPADAAVPAPAPPADGAPAAPTGPAPDFEARLRAVEAVCAEQREVITRQALELLLAVDNAARLRTSREKVGRLKDRAEDAKAASTAAKKAYDAAVDEHFEIEEEVSSGQARLPFRDGPESAEVPEAEAPDTGSMAISPGPRNGAGEDQSWRKVPLGTLGIAEELPHSIVSILGEAGIDTIGALSDYLEPAASGYCRKLTDIAGVGRAKAEKIEAALDAFWFQSAPGPESPGGPDCNAPDVETQFAPGDEAEEERTEAEAEKEAALTEHFEQVFERVNAGLAELVGEPPARAWVVRRVKTGEYLGRVMGEDITRAQLAAEERWSHVDRRAIEVHPAPSAEDDGDPELTGEYDLDGALRAGPGPAPPTATGRCPDCGGVEDRPYGARKAGSRMACHFGADGKVRRLAIAPEEVRRRRGDELARQISEDYPGPEAGGRPIPDDAPEHEDDEERHPRVTGPDDLGPDDDGPDEEDPIWDLETQTYDEDDADDEP